MTTKETMICKNCEEEREKFKGDMPKKQILCASCFENFVEAREGGNNTMTLQQTIEKSDEEIKLFEEFMEPMLAGDWDERTPLEKKRLLRPYLETIVSAYKEELREEIEKTEAIVPPETSPEIYGIHRQGAYAQGYNSAISAVLALIS